MVLLFMVCIGELRFLEVLDVFGCGLTTLPPDFVRLTRLIEYHSLITHVTTTVLLFDLFLP